MKPFPFKPEKYRQYRNTFLQDVEIGFDFLPSDVAKDILNAHFIDYVQSFFNVSLTGDLSSSVCNISKKDLSVSFDFTNKSVVIHLSGKNYIGFSDTAIPQVFKLRSFFSKVVEIKKISQAVIRKVNVFNIKANDQSTISVDQVRKVLFSKEFLADLGTEGLNDQELTIPEFKKCEYQQDDSLLTIRTAFMPPAKPDDGFHHLILDTVGIIKPEDGIKIESIADELMDLNSYLYYSYHWSVSDYVKQVMLQDSDNK